jgi:hypothetical protein
MDEYAAVGFHHKETHGFVQPGIKPSGINDSATCNNKAHMSI